MPRWICGHTKRDHIQNNDIHEIRGGTSLGDVCAASFKMVWTYLFVTG
jgi:hypothetical protein